MAVARKSDGDSSTTGGWFRHRRTQRRKNSPLGTSETNKSGQQMRSPKEAPSVKASSEQMTNHRNVIKSTSMPELNKKQIRVPATSKANPKTNFAPKRSQSRLRENSAIPVMSEAMPNWLLRLHSLQRYSSVMTFSLVLATLVAYGWTVYSQQIWSQAYRKLISLQRDERQLNITNNVLKNNMAVDAEKPSAGLVSPTPAGTIFLPASKSVPDATAPTKILEQNASPAPAY